MPKPPIQLKRSGTASATPSSLEHGELALNYADSKVFWKNASNTISSFTFQSYALSSHTHAASDITSGTLDAARLPLATTIAAGAVIVGTGLGVSSGTVSVTYGTNSTSACRGDDSRLSDTRTPTDGSVTTAKIANDAVTYAKLQNVSATDRLLGRSSAGSGDVEEITCGSFGRSLIGSADAAAARTTLSVQPTASPAFTGAATFDNTGNVVPLTVTNTGTANSFVVNDASGDTSPFVIDASGNVGVGASPSQRLHIHEASANDCYARWTNTDTGTSSGLLIGLNGNEQGIIRVEPNKSLFLGANNTDHIQLTGGGQLLVTAGSASAPGVAFSGDPDTGIAQLSAAGANTLSLIAGGTERFRVNGNGETVSSGTFVAPSGDTSIRGSGAGVGQWLGICGDAAGFGTGPAIIMRSAGAGGSTEFYSGSSQGVIINSSRQLLVTAGSGSSGSYKPGVAVSGDDDTGLQQVGGANTISLVTAGSERVRVDASGNVGIGGAPFYALDVQRTSANAILNVQTTTSGNAQLRIECVGNASSTITQNRTSNNLEITNGSSGSIVFTNNGSERVRVDASGNVGIGKSPSYRLDVLGDLGIDSAGNAVLRYGRNNSYKWAIYNDTSDNFIFYSDAAFAERLRISSTGEVIVGTTDQGAYNLQCNGTGVWGAGAYVNGSDERIKDEIAPIDEATSVITAMQPVTFRYKPTWSSDQSIQPGFIAQQLQEALAGTPYLDGVVQQGTEYLSVAYQSLIPLLVKALQESNARIAALEERNHA